MLPIMNFNNDGTPKYMKNDFSPGGFRLLMPMARSPMGIVSTAIKLQQLNNYLA